MSRAQTSHEGTALWQPVLAIAAMSLTLALVLRLLGWLERADRVLLSWFTPTPLSPPEIELGEHVVWLASALLAVLLPAAILNVAGQGRRLFVWLLSLALTASWGPVLVLAARKPDLSPSLVVVAWAGFCAFVYAAKHPLPADGADTKNVSKPEKNHGPR